MENTPLHAQKVTILSRLIKESSLTLEEALLLLKEEETVKSPLQTNPFVISAPGTGSPYWYGGSSTLTGTGTGSGVITMGSSTTTAFLNTPSTHTADLNS